MQCIIVTNNKKVKNAFYRDNKVDVDYVDGGDYLEVLYKVRDYVQQGHQLVTHPISGGLKPNQTPSLSIVTGKSKEKLDFDSAILIEKSIEVAQKFLDGKVTPSYNEKIRNDFETVDLSIISSAINHIRRCSF